MAPVGRAETTTLPAGLERRATATAVVAERAGELAAACAAVADRILGGGRLIAVSGTEASADAHHLAVEFLHPALVGKRAVPAFALVCATGAEAARGLTLLGAAADSVVVIGRTPDDPVVREALRTARGLGMLTLALVPDPYPPHWPHPPHPPHSPRLPHPPHRAGHVLAVPSGDPLVVKEVHVTAYHLLWELTQLFLEHEGPGGDDYDFLGGTLDRRALLDDAAEAIRAKAAETTALRARVVTGLGPELARCGRRLASAFRDGARLFAFGNGGSATDASDLAATFLSPPRGRAVPAWALPDDTAVVTALTNDIGFDVVFARQLEALARPGDVAVGLSTSGGSANVVRGLDRARRRGMLAVGLAGHDGGAMAAPGLADHLFVVPSRSVHRVQEAQATISHLLWELVQEELCASGCPDG
ncbi:SIS domain-containing protein [Actinomadura gamaensis]|uniref:SIS domain-containing protein n=1 Tax=Actinomadura gamaensis TaxID=1763541 RepID=A0ABV9TSL2_9ACTN